MLNGRRRNSGDLQQAFTDHVGGKARTVHVSQRARCGEVRADTVGEVPSTVLSTDSTRRVGGSATPAWLQRCAQRGRIRISTTTNFGAKYVLSRCRVGSKLGLRMAALLRNETIFIEGFGAEGAHLSQSTALVPRSIQDCSKNNTPREQATTRIRGGFKRTRSIADVPYGPAFCHDCPPPLPAPLDPVRCESAHGQIPNNNHSL